MFRNAVIGSSSHEFGLSNGLNLNDLDYKPFKNKIGKIDFHIGFNEVKYPPNSKLATIYPKTLIFIFYMATVLKLKKKKLLRDKYYKFNFVSSYEKQNVLGVQFHPEKSKMNGVQIIKNYISYKC